MKKIFPTKKQILEYSLVGTLLTTIIPISLLLENAREGYFMMRVLNIFILIILVVLIFYSSLWLNLWCNKSSSLKIFCINLVSLVIITSLNILIHSPFWKLTINIPLSHYIIDAIVRNVTIFIASYLAAKYYLKNIENNQIKIYLTELEKENLSNQVRSLTQQINPHFFFNSLNTLGGLVQENPEKSELFIDKLAQVFRYILKIEDNNLILLNNELKFMQDYIFLLKMRFEDKLIINVDVPDEDNYFVVSLCTQMLIENVIKHNRINRESPMTINICVEDNSLRVSNTVSLQKKIKSSGLGLKNLNKRCELIVGKSIVIEQTEALFSVKVPLVKVKHYSL